MMFQTWDWLTAKDLTVGQFFLTFVDGIPDRVLQVSTFERAGNDVTINGTLFYKARQVVGIPQPLISGTDD